jgi:hypothetical protein
VSILSAAKEMDCPIIPIISLTLSTIVFGTLYYDAVPHSPVVQIALLAFSIATAFGYWIHANLICCPDGLLTKGDVQGNEAPAKNLLRSFKLSKPAWMEKVPKFVMDRYESATGCPCSTEADGVCPCSVGSDGVCPCSTVNCMGLIIITAVISVISTAILFTLYPTAVTQLWNQSSVVLANLKDEIDQNLDKAMTSSKNLWTKIADLFLLKLRPLVTAVINLSQYNPQS